MEVILVSYYDVKDKIRYFVEFQALWAAKLWISQQEDSTAVKDCKIYNATLTEVTE